MEVLRAVLIHLVVPASGLCVYLWLRRRMREAEVVDPPEITLFIVFATYGGWLMEILTLLFWYWSGMALLGAAYLMFLAPIVMLVLAVLLYPKRKLSPYHYASFLACSGYFLLPIGVLIFRSVMVAPYVE